ncbi:MAG: fibrobacter succinogenes major paralogous domain-containing protein [Bacteroidales bacterium]|jgi:uncharacterized protein (TIGR02145 family)
MKTPYFLLLIITLVLIPGCKKKVGEVPAVQTVAPDFYSSKMVTLGCRVTSDGGTPILDCGLYFSMSAGADITGQKFSMGSDTGFFAGQVTGLTAITPYFVKAYATNAAGTTFGQEITFTTPPFLIDIDQNVYSTVIIGSQTWMGKNLQVAHFSNGDPIPTTTPETLDISSDENSPLYFWDANGDPAATVIYGSLYTWYAVTDTRNVCPTGWHVPSDVEWSQLENAVGGYLYAASFLKESGNTDWLSPYNTDANNLSCFTALPAGYRPATGGFALLQNEAHFWTSTESEATKGWERAMTATSFSDTRQGAAKNSGQSVRCIKD